MPKKTKRTSNEQDVNEREAVRALFTSLAGQDPETVRAVLRDNPALAEALLDQPDLQQLVRSAGVQFADATQIGGHDGAEQFSAALEARDEQPGLFTELTRELPVERAAQLYRKVAPLLVYELLRKLDQNANVAMVQRIVDRLCSPETQTRLRASAHVRDALLDEVAEVLCDQGLRAKLDRAGVLKIMEACGVTGELITMVNCIRLTQAAG